MALATVTAALFSGMMVSGSGPAVAYAVVEPSGRSVTASLRSDLEKYLDDQGAKDHFSAVSLRVTYADQRPDISVDVGTFRYGGGRPVNSGALWQIGSNTKAFTSVLLLQLETEGKLSMTDKLGQWLPEYPAWRDVTITQLLSMTSGIPNYTEQSAFLRDFDANPYTRFTLERLMSYVEGLPLGPPTYEYSNTNYLLAQMIVERASHDTYVEQLAERIIEPLGMNDTCLPPYCPPGTASRMPTPYSTHSDLPNHLNKSVPPLALSWAQGAGGLVSSLEDMTAWDRALYSGQLLPPAQQRELESLVSMQTSESIENVTADDPMGFGLGLVKIAHPVAGTVWFYEGATYGNRVLHMYLPETGTIIAIAVNSAVGGEDTLPDLAGTVYETLSAQNATSSPTTPVAPEPAA
ncbi:serine hydrolase domain-containing protein [Streptomyces xiamenensis]|uniref:serine hydrolase domain-containing protein n=1 Tax=Streptomyces xiamenensis TaxID=408015 RepID=UPI00062875B7|nr:serine hydrolase domain-containing protein [Streptomyces xiamenensis]